VSNDEPGILKQVANAGGPTNWAYNKITQFVLGMVIGAVTGVADSLAGALGAVEESFRYAGSQGAAAFATVESAVVGALNFVFGEVETAVAWAGPLGPLVYLVVAAVLFALAWRLLRAVADSVPIASGIQTLVEGK